MQNTQVVKAKQAVQQAQPLEKGERFELTLKRDDVQDRFRKVLGQKANAFIASLLSMYNANPALAAADPKSILASAMTAATLDLPINPNLAFAHLIPYKGVCQFQMGYRGFIQLAMRTGQYKTINATEVYEGELKSMNKFTGEMEFAPEGRKSDKIIGYVAYFKLVNGFEKYFYMTAEQLAAHGKKYSKTYSLPNGRWAVDPHSMSLKTVIKLLLNKYGILSVDLQRALVIDQSVPKNLEGEVDPAQDYIDSPETPQAEPAEVLSEEEKKQILESEKGAQP